MIDLTPVHVDILRRLARGDVAVFRWIDHWMVWQSTHDVLPPDVWELDPDYVVRLYGNAVYEVWGLTAQGLERAMEHMDVADAP